MSIVGKIHEISFYGLVVTIVCLIKNKLSFSALYYGAFHATNFITYFEFYLFWSSVLYIPIAIIGAFYTKYVDDGEGLLFDSDSILVIIFGHVAEEILGIVGTPFWFLKDLFTQELDEYGKIIDYITWLIEIIIIAIGIFILWHN
jgi:hypothetical protein